MAYPRFQRSRDFKYKNVNTQLTVNSTNWTNVGTSIDITLSAQTGDVIEVNMDGLYASVAEYVFFDVCTVVSGSPVNYFGWGSSDPGSGEGIRAWYGSGLAADFQSVGGGSVYELAGGDISNGTVTLRLRVRCKTGAARDVTVYHWWAKNLGPQDPN